jgi:adenylate kinase family enzyme
VIIWINGGFGAGKTTLAAELHRRLPDAVVYDPEDVGLMLWKWMPPNDEMAAAAARQPGGTLLLRSDRLSPAGLADEVLASL